MILKEIGMIFMIKKIFILLTVSSCSVIGFGELPGLIRDTINGRDIEITNEIFQIQPYSFAKVNIGRNIVAITVLASIKDDVYLWVSSDNERIYTKNGKIIETFGLKHDIKYLNIEDIHFQRFSAFESSVNNTLLLELDDPKAVINYSYEIDELGIDPDFFNTMSYEEKFKSSKLSWNGRNNYWVDTRGRVVKSKQFIHPMMPEISMEFYYK